MKKIVVGITGASGSIYGIRILEELGKLGVESHLILSDWAGNILEDETGYTVEQVKALADVVYDYRNMGASVSSGSFLHDGMVIAPCSMKTLAAVHSGYCDNLINRAADVTIKEGRRLLLVVRETPLSPIHLRNMQELAAIGVRIMPPVPAFYHKPQTIEDIVNHSVSRMLDQLGIENTLGKRWQG